MAYHVNAHSQKDHIRPRRFFSDQSLPLPNETLLLSKTETRHLRKVLRYHVGDCCLVTDRNGSQAQAEIVEFLSSGQAQLRILKMEALKDPNALKNSSNRWHLTLCIALPQRGKFEWMIEKAQELGIDGLIPLKTERTIIKIPAAKAEKVNARWEKVLCEAAKQSGNLKWTRILPVMTLRKALETAGEEARLLFFHPEQGGLSLPEAVVKIKEEMRTESRDESLHRLYGFIGPEGGFTRAEYALALQRGAQTVSLGKTLLKMDTAFLSAGAYLRWNLH